MCLLGFEPAAAATLVILHLPGGEEVMLNAEEIVTMRPAKHARDEDHIQKDIRCLINTNDGKFISVTETCDAVRSLVGK